MWDLIVTSTDREMAALKKDTFRTFVTWFDFFNLAAVAVACLFLLKLKKGLVSVWKWLFPALKTVENPTIVVIGPKNDITRNIIDRLSVKFGSDLVELEKLDWNLTDHSLNCRSNKSTLLYTHEPMVNLRQVQDVSRYIEKTYNGVDILVIVQKKNLFNKSDTYFFLEDLNQEFLQHFWTVVAFLPEMIKKNRGHIFSIQLGRSSSMDTDVIQAVSENLKQSNSNVRLTLIKKNTFFESFLPNLSSDTWAKMVVESMWMFHSLAEIPRASSSLFLLPTSLMWLIINSILKFNCFSLAR